MSKLRLSQLQQSGAADGEVATWDDAAGIWVPAPGSGGGGGGISWLGDVVNALTSLTGITTSGGTWTVSSGQVQAVTTTGNFGRAVSNIPVGFAAMSIVEAEVEIPATFNASGQSIGILLTNSAAGANAFAFRIEGNGKIRMERDGSANLGDVNYTVPAAGTWVKLRMVIIGNQAVGFVDGVLAYRGSAFNFGDANGWMHPGLICFGATTVRFRNLKAWSADLGLPA